MTIRIIHSADRALVTGVLLPSLILCGYVFKY
jgi:hypothetical protein